MRERLERTLTEYFPIKGPLDPQTRHRIELVDFWRPNPGARILEVGCGPGDTTAVLAAAVGKTGHVLAVEKSPGRAAWGLTGLPRTLTQAEMPLSKAVEDFLSAHVYGASTSLGTPMPVLLASPLGQVTSFRVGLDLLENDIDFPPKSFDMVVFSHCSWYFERPDVLGALFSRVRPWAKSLAYAEWSPIPDSLAQLPHLLAALLQLQVLALYPGAVRRNVVSLILPRQAREMAASSGWRIVRRHICDTVSLQDAVWEGRVAHELAQFRHKMNPAQNAFIASCQELLATVEERIGGGSSLHPEARQELIDAGRLHSLPTEAFLAVPADAAGG
jgi:SAM-dependent methyltransferase